MSDFKSKLPDLKELGDIAGKLFKDIKTSVGEIIDTYKEKRAQPEPTTPSTPEAASEKKEDVNKKETSAKEEAPSAEKKTEEKE